MALPILLTFQDYITPNVGHSEGRKPIFRTSSRSDNGIFLTRHQGALERMSPAFGAISVKMAG